MEVSLIANSVLGLGVWFLVITCAIPLSFLYIWKKAVCNYAKLLGWIGGPKLIPLGTTDINLATGILQENPGGVDSCRIGFLLRIGISELREHFTKLFLGGKPNTGDFFTASSNFLATHFFENSRILNYLDNFTGCNYRKESVSRTIWHLG